ncbi:MAG: flagellar hook-length control protein FliK [Sphingomonadales bacterium]|nr:flagellar hook-length control protein FliK [Sphingomonadales bacterium]
MTAVSNLALIFTKTGAPASPPGVATGAPASFPTLLAPVAGKPGDTADTGDARQEDAAPGKDLPDEQSGLPDALAWMMAPALPILADPAIAKVADAAPSPAATPVATTPATAQSTAALPLVTPDSAPAATPPPVDPAPQTVAPQIPAQQPAAPSPAPVASQPKAQAADLPDPHVDLPTTDQPMPPAAPRATTPAPAPDRIAQVADALRPLLPAASANYINRFAAVARPVAPSTPPAVAPIAVAATPVTPLPVTPQAAPAVAAPQPVAPVQVGTPPAPQAPAAPVPAETARVEAPVATPAPVAPAAPVQPAVQPTAIAPAAQVFAEAIHRAATDERTAATPQPTVFTLPAGTDNAVHAVAATGDSRHAALDLKQDNWPQAMIQRIEALRDTANANDTRIRLIPAALGAIDVSLKREGDAVSVHLAAHQPETQQILADAQPRLADLAESRGLKLSASTGSAATDAGGHAASQQQQQQRATQTAAAMPVRPASAANAADEAASDERIA